MKTPLNNFEFTYDFKGTEFGGLQIFTIAQHKTLKLKIVESYFLPPVTWFKSDYSLEEIKTKLLRKLISFIWEMSEKGIACPPILFNDIVTGKENMLYFGQWDKEKEAWFILDENNNRIYE